MVGGPVRRVGVADLRGGVAVDAAAWHIYARPRRTRSRRSTKASHPVIRSYAIRALFASTLLVAAAYASAFLPGGAPEWAAGAMLLGMSGSIVAAMVLGAARDGRVGRLAAPFTLVFLLLVGGFGAVLVLPAADPADPSLWLGLPPRAAAVLYGIGLVPLLLVPLAYALSFDERTLRPGDLERIRRHRASRPDSGNAL
jgi:hypothetical protein